MSTDDALFPAEEKTSTDGALAEARCPAEATSAQSPAEEL